MADYFIKLPVSSGGSGAVDSVFGRTGTVVAQAGDYSKSDVGLGNVDNTSDLNKPISTATQTALDAKMEDHFYFGNGADGNVTISSGTTTLVRSMFYNTLTMSGTGVLNTSSFKVFGLNLDLTNAPAGAIIRNGGNGSNSSSGTGGTAGLQTAAADLGGGGAATAGGAGAVGAGVAGAAATNVAPANGGGSGSSGGGGAGTPGAASGTRAGATATSSFLFRKFSEFIGRGIQLMVGGAGGPGGGSGGGDGTNTGRGGGGGGAGGGVVFLSFKTITKGASTPANVIQATGGNGGNGASGATGNVGGGGGAGGAGGGWILIYYKTLVGTVVSNLINASGGNGGNGGNGIGTGAGGAGGQGGAGGRVTLVDLSSGIVSETVGSAGTGPTLPSGITGGTGGAGNSLQVAL